MGRRHLTPVAGPVSAVVTAGLLTARGMPYGHAARFRPPDALPPWTEVHDGARRGPVPPQLPSRLGFVTGPAVDGLETSEDCLVLSVTAPADTTDCPVMVWFHGGAYVSGSGESALYDPDPLVAEGGVVVVTVSYRLGLLGYLNPDAAAPQNLGLRDQILALRWVHQNIAAFGGDPSQVTVFGQSAGGDSVLSLMLCPAADGLFTRAIMHSAPLGVRDGREPMTAAMRAAVADALGDVAPTDATVAQLLDAQVTAAAAATVFPTGGMAYGPIIGLDPLPAAADVGERLARAATDVELVIGYTRDDAAPFVVMAMGSPDPGATTPDPAAVAAVTDRFFGDPADEFAATFRAIGGRVSTYRVDWAPPGAPLGACHCIELPLLFAGRAAWRSAPMLGPGTDPIDQDLARDMRAHWTGFARHGSAAWEARHRVFA